MKKILGKTLSYPLEREYEAWIVRCIEDYLAQARVCFHIMAVSPLEEASWPADEKLFFEHKVVGLQFKRAKVARGTPSFDRLCWPLSSPPRQFSLIQRQAEIFYCLPTFTNRELRSRALDHCLFWRPDGSSSVNVWYDNPAARSACSKISNSMRWGFFIERLFACEIGKRNRSIEETASYFAELYASMRDVLPRDLPEDNSSEAFDGQYSAGLYLLFLGIRDGLSPRV